MIETINTIVLYTTAVCNLNCKYCFIDKNPALKSIDDILDESFKGDYYFNYCKELFPNPNQLTKLETWGGEPFLRMDRAYYTIEKLLGYYPNLNHFFSSSNLTTSNFIEQLAGLFKTFEKYAPRKIHYGLQISLDGPEYITDRGRGLGVTKKLTENFDKLLNSLNEILPSNIDFDIHFKPTLDTISIYELQTEEKIIEYYQFFEEYYEKAFNVKLKNFKCGISLPNTACPSPHTKEDGIAFKNFCKLCRQIEKKNKMENIFKHYEYITPFPSHFNGPSIDIIKDQSIIDPCAVCGSGVQIIGLLPNRMISGCHMAFVDLIGDYKKYSNEHLGGDTTIDFHMFTSDKQPLMTFPVEELSNYSRQMETFYKEKACAKTVSLSSLIQFLALTKQIDDQYKSLEKSIEAARFIQSHTSVCLRDNYVSTGSVTMYPLGILRLLLNGAKEYITNECQ